MAHDVFISYSQKDKPAADAACAALEAAGVRCWIAPRDVPHQMSWPAAIVGAIGHSRVMVLIFSKQAIASDEVQREVVNAFQEHLVVVPLRIEDVRPSGDMAYYMRSTHWLDAITPPLTTHLKQLCQIVQAVLATAPHKQESQLRQPNLDAAPQTQKPTRAPEKCTQNDVADASQRVSILADFIGIASRAITVIRSSRFAQGVVLVLASLGAILFTAWIADWHLRLGGESGKSPQFAVAPVSNPPKETSVASSKPRGSLQGRQVAASKNGPVISAEDQEGADHLKKILTSYKWGYMDSLYPGPAPGDRVRFYPKGKFHDVWHWNYWVVGPHTMHIQFWDPKYNPKTAVVATFNDDLTEFHASFAGHKVTGTRLEPITPN